MLATHPMNPHDADKRLNRASQIGRFNAADANLSMGFGTQHGHIKHDPDPRYRKICRRKVKGLVAQYKMDIALHGKAFGAATFSHLILVKEVPDTANSPMALPGSPTPQQKSSRVFTTASNPAAMLALYFGPDIQPDPKQ